MSANSPAGFCRKRLISASMYCSCTPADGVRRSSMASKTSRTLCSGGLDGFLSFRRQLASQRRTNRKDPTDLAYSLVPDGELRSERLCESLAHETGRTKDFYKE